MTDQSSGMKRSGVTDWNRKESASDARQAAVERFSAIFQRSLANAFAIRTGKVPEVSWRVTERLPEAKLLAGLFGEHLVFQTSLMDGESGALAAAVPVDESDLFLHLAGAENPGGTGEVPDPLIDTISAAFDEAVRELAVEGGCPFSCNPLLDSVRPLDEEWFHETFPGATVAVRTQFEVAAPGRMPSSVYLFYSDAFVELLETEVFMAAGEDNVNVRPAGFQNLTPGRHQGEPRNLDLLLDVGLTVRVELGRTSLRVQEVLELGPGSVVELDKLAGEPVDLLVNERLFARGEVVVIDENFGVRVTDIVSAQERIHALRRSGS